MKPHLLKVPKAASQSFGVRRDVAQFFYKYWHYHPELELTYIKKGSGTYFVGDRIESFEGEELIFLGKNLPHLWQTHAPAKTEADRSEAIVVHFTEDFWGGAFLDLPEMSQVRGVMEKAGRGLKITGQTRHKVASAMEKMLECNGLDRLLLLLGILKILADSPDLQSLSDARFDRQFNETETRRLEKIYAFSLENFTRPVCLEEVAAVASMSQPAFCRYFKSRTRKTYSAFLLELRLSHACNLLMNTETSVAQVCYESGFNTFSNFNRYFKKSKGMTPVAYRKQYLAS